MKTFWKLSNGQDPIGDENSSHAGSFKIIPEGTMAIAAIKDFLIDDSRQNEFYKIVYKITSGEYKNREVIQKIKCFDEKPSVSDRAINMLKRIHDLCGIKPLHDGPPSNEDVARFRGRALGIKISEWSMVREDGTIAEGNYVSEIHPIEGFVEMSGERLNQKPKIESAFSRNPAPSFDDDDISTLF